LLIEALLRDPIAVKIPPTDNPTDWTTDLLDDMEANLTEGAKTKEIPNPRAGEMPRHLECVLHA
jgi:hypothetical protein